MNVINYCLKITVELFTKGIYLIFIQIFITLVLHKGFVIINHHLINKLSKNYRSTSETKQTAQHQKTNKSICEN